MEKKLYRSRQNKQLCGVCGGIAKYMNVDPTVIRLICVLVSLFGPGLLAYLVCALVIPEEPENIIDAE